MAEDLLTTILAFIYTIVHGTGGKIAGLIQFISGVALPQTIIDAIGLLVILTILLAIAWVAKKSIQRGKKSASKTTPEPKIEKRIETENGLEQRTEKKATKEIIPETNKYPEAFVPSGIMIQDGNNIEYLLNELHKIDMIIRLDLEKWKKEHGKDADDFMGLYISENEVNAMLTPHEFNAEAGSIEEKIQIIFREINRSLETEKSLRLHEFQELFKLDPFEVDALLICLASELDMRYERLYSYIQNDVTKKRPTVDLVINLLRPTIEERVKAREYFSSTAALIRNRLIYLTSDRPDGEAPLLSRSIKVDERIVSYLLGSDEIDQRIRNFSSIIEPEYLFSWDNIPGNDNGRLIDFLKQNYGIDWVETAKIEKIDDGKTIILSTEKNSLYLKLNDEKTNVSLKIDDGRTYEFIAKMENGKLNIYEPEKYFDDLILPEKEKNSIRELIKHRQNIKNPMFFFHGAYGTGKKMTAEVICRELGIPLLVVDLRALMKGEPRETLRIIIREACLQNSSLYLEGFDALLEKEAGVNITALFQELDLFPNWVFLAGELPYTPSGILKNHSFIEMAFPIPSFTFRKKLWEILLKEKVPDLDIDALAGKFNFSGGQIKDAISTAQNYAMVRNPADITMTMEDLYRGCKAQSNKNLSLFARSISPRYSWNDIVLPKDLKEHLKEVSGYIKHRGKVYTDWGFDAKLSLGKGLNVLFSGPSGAGKTMAAEVIAKEAGLDIYKIDLSTVVSKYIGETEKILNKIFLEAETSNAILFFDEADALFGKRSEVKDSHDRYANIETNYLLQKMEEHEGIVILASNFKTNIDEAFLRRMHFVMEFPFPEEDLREKIWRNIFPKATPVGEDVDYGFLSRFKITGGNIKNIALSAAFLAAGDSGVVKMEHIIRATKREFQKMGKLCTAGEFGEYYNLVK